MAGGFAEPSQAKYLTRLRLSETEGILNVPLPMERSAYSDPSFVREIADTLLLSADYRRLIEIGLVQPVEWSMAHIYKVRRVINFIPLIYLCVESNVLCLCRAYRVY